MTTIQQHFDIDMYRIDGDRRDMLDMTRMIHWHLRKRIRARRYERMMERRR